MKTWWDDAAIISRHSSISSHSSNYIVHTVKFDSRGGDPAPGDQHIVHGERVAKVHAMSRNTDGFGGWFTDLSFTRQWNFYTDRVTSNMTLYAKWETRITYTVTFDADPGITKSASLSNPWPDDQIILSGEKVIEPAVLRKAQTSGGDDWCSFGGWYTDTSWTKQWNFATDRVYSDITLYAKWTIPPPRYTVTFVPYGGTPEPRPQDLAPGTKVIEPYAMNWTGYGFGGWYTDAEFTKQWNFAADTVNSNITLYARWVSNFYDIVFVANGGTPAPAPQRVAHGMRISKPAVMKLEGRGFTGWYTNPGCTGEPWNFDLPVTSAITLYAGWGDKHYIVKFDLKLPPSDYTPPSGGGHGNIVPENQDVSSQGKVIEPPDPSNRAGWAFAGWFYHNNGANITPPQTAWGSAELGNLEPWDFDNVLKEGAVINGHSLDDDLLYNDGLGDPPVLYLYARWVKNDNPDLVWVRSGSFLMGAAGSGTSPVRNVKITKGFYIGKYPVQQGATTSAIETQPSQSQQEYYAIMNGNTVGSPSNNADPSQFKANQRTRPVERVSWYDALYFCDLLSDKYSLEKVYNISGFTTGVISGQSTYYAITGAAFSEDFNNRNFNKSGFRLPTEAEWEYAARGGNGSPGDYNYAGSNNPDDVAWYNTNSGSMTHPVGTKMPNALGIYDMSGNVMEWCWDWYGSQYYREQTNSTDYIRYNADIDPKGPSLGTERVRRGGSWNNAYGNVRNVVRNSWDPGGANWTIGFRVVRYPKADEMY